MKPPVCRTCGKPVVNGNLYCSHECGQGNVSHSATAQALEHRGFVRHEDVANCYVKDGVSVTLEMVARIGLERALFQHESAVSALRGM